MELKPLLRLWLSEDFISRKNIRPREGILHRENIRDVFHTKVTFWNFSVHKRPSGSVLYPEVFLEVLFFIWRSSIFSWPFGAGFRTPSTPLCNLKQNLQLRIQFAFPIMATSGNFSWNKVRTPTTQICFDFQNPNESSLNEILGDETTERHTTQQNKTKWLLK